MKALRHPFFEQADFGGQKMLKNVLGAYSACNRAVEFGKGCMNELASFLLLVSGG